MLRQLRTLFRGASSRAHQQAEALTQLQLSVGRSLALQMRSSPIRRLQDAEFRVFSQWGEDGIIQFLIGSVPIERDTFVEIGVGDYRESNTRFLLCNNNWKGVIIDAGTEHIETLAALDLLWRYTIRGVSSWITPETINDELSRTGLTGDLGLLSLDIDGNDYWVLEAIDVVSPRILVVEYNSVFGPHHAVTVPYRADFRRAKAHYSQLYAGASLSALDVAARRKGYRLVGSNSAGNNAFFLREDLGATIPTQSVAEAYVQSRFRESRDASGRLSYLDPHTKGLRLIADLPLVDVIDDRLVRVRDLFELDA